MAQVGFDLGLLDGGGVGEVPRGTAQSIFNLATAAGQEERKDKRGQ
jgi:hypothetical protein